MPEAAAEGVMVGVIALTRRLAVARRRGLATGEWGGKAQRVLAKCGNEAGVRRCGKRRHRPNETETQREQREGPAKWPAGSPQSALVHRWQLPRHAPDPLFARNEIKRYSHERN
jgi:hypothetical protein